MDEEFNNNMFLAREDFKRVDHIIYVSLKYTKTVDMMRNGIERMISTMYYLREHLLTLAYEKDLIEAIPKIEIHKGNLLKKLINKEEFDFFIEFYRQMRRLVKAPFTKHHEFRKNMCMIATDDELGEVTVDTEKIMYYYNKLNEFVKLTELIESENFGISEPEK